MVCWVSVNLDLKSVSHSLRRPLASERAQVHRRDWYAYPQLSPPKSFPPFQLASGIYYNNAIESAASAMVPSASHFC